MALVLALAVAGLAGRPAAAAEGSRGGPVGFSTAAPPAADSSSAPEDRAAVLLRLDGLSFYGAVGRPDLAERYQRRKTVKVASQIGGAITLAGAGLAAAFVSFSRSWDSSCDPGRCSSPSYLVPALMFAGGLTLLVWPLGYDTDPVNAQEKRVLAEEAASRSRAVRPRVDVSIVPGGGAALALSGRF